MNTVTYKQVLNFWFSGVPLGKEQLTRWWGKDSGVDQFIRQQYAGLVDDINQALYKEWSQTSRPCLAAIICLDQFPRNMYRGQPQAFAYDHQARELVEKGLALNYDQKLADLEKNFFIMPLMHHEAIDSQQRCVQLCQKYAGQADPEFRQYLHGSIRFAEQHRDIIARFGRFPHRNNILGRESTPEELKFLQQPGSSF